MSTWNQLLAAHRVSASSAYGTSADGAYVPQMSVDFAIALCDGWADIASKGAESMQTQSLFSLGDQRYGYIQQAIYHLEQDRNGLPSGDGSLLVDNPSAIWNHVASVASLLDSSPIAGPSVAETSEEYLGPPVAWLKDNLQKAANAAAGPIEVGLFLIAGIVLLALFLRIRG